MRIIKCNITNFGCYSNKTFNFSTTLNSFCVNNGEGKTTLAVFIKAMFYSLEKSSTKSYERKHYKPYSGGIYGGSIEIELDGKIYKIERTFGDSPTKDILRIFDENGTNQRLFLSRPIYSLQGEASSKLGELILGIDAFSFQKCNFISANDLDFSSSESIKMKIGNIVIDKERENSYEDTISSIVDGDLRDKVPTAKKNENAYPYRIKELENANKQKNNEIKQLNDLENNLNNLYAQRDEIKSQLELIEKKQKECELLNVKKGQLSVVEQFDFDIKKEQKNIDDINQKYNFNLPTKDEITQISECVSEYENCQTIGETYRITPADIEKLQQLEENVVSDDDYTKLVDANSKMTANIDFNGLTQINEERYSYLKQKFEGKSIKDEMSLNQDYIDYKSLLSQEQKSNNFHMETKDYPSEIILTHIENRISNYNDLCKKLEDIKSSYKEKTFIVKLLLIIITLGIYLIVLNNKKKKYLKETKENEKAINEIKNELDTFFLKYNVEFGTYEVKMKELKSQIAKYYVSQNENGESGKYDTEILSKIDRKEKELLTYFARFDYINLDVNEAYNLYKKESKEYNDLISIEKRNNQIKQGIQSNTNQQIEIIKTILKKYNLTMSENFSVQLLKLKEDLEFYKTYKPIYINKKANDEQKKKCEMRINSILCSHKIPVTIDIILCAKNVINDNQSYINSKENEAELISKKNKFLSDNNLNGFNPNEIETNQDELRNLHEQKNTDLLNKENAIKQNEDSIARKDDLEDEINSNNELISKYREKIKIANLARKALEEANLNMERKYISPIKNSFVTYATKIYDKIGSNLSMDYDYEIKYDINGQLRDAKDLSDGERTIMMLALRFAVLDSLYKNHDSVIILDDPFDSLDSSKLKKAIDLIKELSKDWQIIYFTCHESRQIDNY